MSVDVAECLSTLALEMALADSRSRGLLSDRRRVARAVRGVIMPDLPPGPMTSADGQASGDGQSNITLSDAEGQG
jgi:hypothetical protein